MRKRVIGVFVVAAALTAFSATPAKVSTEAAAKVTTDANGSAFPAQNGPKVPCPDWPCN
jgi:hypothetical protein